MHHFYKLAMAQQRVMALTTSVDPDNVVGRGEVGLAEATILRPRLYWLRIHH